MRADTLSNDERKRREKSHWTNGERQAVLCGCERDDLVALDKFLLCWQLSEQSARLDALGLSFVHSLRKHMAAMFVRERAANG